MNRDVLCVIPARSGSVRIRHKNLMEVGGRTLLERAVATARQVCERVVVSTDDERYAAIARHAGARVPALRPPHLAGETSSTEDVVRQVLQDWEHAPIVCVLQTTSPFTTAEHVRSVLAALRSNPGARSAFTARRLDPSGCFAFAAGKDGVAVPLAPHLLPLRSQDLPALVVPTGGVYAVRSADLIGGASLVDWPAVYALVDERGALDIDDAGDLEQARRWADAG